jgi:hypothetical protein
MRCRSKAEQRIAGYRLSLDSCNNGRFPIGKRPLFNGDYFIGRDAFSRSARNASYFLPVGTALPVDG